MTTNEPYVTKRDLATHLAMSVRWVEVQLKKGMPHYRFGRCIRFRLSEVEQWLS